MSRSAVRLAEGWLVQVIARGGVPPLLIVADHHAIAQGALGWHEQLAAAGWDYRVRLGEVASHLHAAEALAVAEEAARFRAKAILAIGGDSVMTVAAAAAGHASLPLVQLPPA